MKNQVYAGNVPALSLPVPAGTKAGDPVKVGGFIGVCATDRNDGTTPDPSGNPTGHASVEVDGTYSLLVPEAVAAIATPIYITGANALTTTAAGNTLFGHTHPVISRGVASGAIKAADSGTPGRVNVKLVTV